jgi:ring-1,2-phenylacetyl-CoA epoxidase subunit PaaD
LVTEELSLEVARAALATIPDPEIPAISITELGIVRGLAMNDDRIEVTITPTYSGCPAMAAIAEDVIAKLREIGFSEVKVKTVLSPAWSTDWIDASAHARLRACGIVPPHSLSDTDTHRIRFFTRAVGCPRCDSRNTERLSEFGSTACKAIYRCLACREPFDVFKPI